jgi:hypothetical protein
MKFWCGASAYTRTMSESPGPSMYGRAIEDREIESAILACAEGQTALSTYKQFVRHHRLPDQNDEVRYAPI